MLRFCCRTQACSTDAEALDGVVHALTRFSAGRSIFSGRCPAGRPCPASARPRPSADVAPATLELAHLVGLQSRGPLLPPERLLEHPSARSHPPPASSRPAEARPRSAQRKRFLHDERSSIGRRWKPTSTSARNRASRRSRGPRGTARADAGRARSDRAAAVSVKQLAGWCAQPSDLRERGLQSGEHLSQGCFVLLSFACSYSAFSDATDSSRRLSS